MNSLGEIMNCYIKRINNNTFFKKNIDKNFNHWTTMQEAKMFESVIIAKYMIKFFNLKNVEIVKITKKR